MNIFILMQPYRTRNTNEYRFLMDYKTLCKEEEHIYDGIAIQKHNIYVKESYDYKRFTLNHKNKTILLYFKI
jgi:hypothetical protein